MRIGLLGGTGDLGRGLALRWARRHEIFVGSRDARRGQETAATYAALARQAYGGRVQAIRGDANETIAAMADTLILTLPAGTSVEYLKQLKRNIAATALVVSPVVFMRKTAGIFTYVASASADGPGSIAEAFARELKPIRVVAAFHTVPAGKLADPRAVVEGDVLIASDDRASFDTVAALVREIPKLRPLSAGPLAVARLIEPLTPLLLNVGIRNRLREPSLRIV